MFSIFKKKEAELKSQIGVCDYSAIKVDMHSHVLPGIDDGAQTPSDSIELIKKMQGLGIKKIIATPHIMVDYYKNNAETINNALEILKAELNNEGIDIDLAAAAEHYFDETFEDLVNTGKLMTMGDNFVLFEIPTLAPPHNLIEIIRRMMELRYKPILAHPERYPYFKLENFKTIKGYGCRLQLNTISLTGYYGKQAKKTAEELADNNLLDFISSDMHHPRHADAFEHALSLPYVQRLLNSPLLKNTSLL
jgi:tyrosine-protein phosphatase YwqE